MPRSLDVPASTDQLVHDSGTDGYTLVVVANNSYPSEAHRVLDRQGAYSLEFFCSPGSEATDRRGEVADGGAAPQPAYLGELSGSRTASLSSVP